MSIELGDGQLIFRGVVNDPRNRERAWIETSAYLFDCSSETNPQAGDDARIAQWFALDELPPLYASHQTIVERALDVIVSSQELQLSAEAIRTPVDGGHMDYDKYIADSAFVKIHHNARPTHLLYLKKEADIMSHLRTTQYSYVPRMSHMPHEHMLVMEALAPDKGWYWRAPVDLLDEYIDDTLEAFATLERQPLPADVYDIDGSFGTHTSEGWPHFTPEKRAKITPLLNQLRPDTQVAATRLLANCDELQSLARTIQLPGKFVFCHHDARQANIAWHPTHGARIVDWAWADIGRPRSDITTLLIDLHKHGHDVSPYRHLINPEHCLTMIGFWLEHASWPIAERSQSIRLQQFLSAVAGYEVLESM